MEHPQEPSPDLTGRAGTPGAFPGATPTRALVVAALCAFALGGIAACTPGRSGPAPTPPSSATPTQAAPGTTGAASAPADDPSLPSAPGTDPPATAAGPLTGADLPTPQDLGPGWTARVEEGDVEDGPGNGTPYQRRDPTEVVEVVVPLGCEQRSALPVPAHALQATYAREGDFAVALLLQFDSSTRAASFAEVRAADLDACLGQPADPFSGAAAPVTEVGPGERVTRAEYVVAEDPATTWNSAMWLSGDRVLIVDATAPVDLRDWSGA